MLLTSIQTIKGYLLIYDQVKQFKINLPVIPNDQKLNAHYIRQLFARKICSELVPDTINCGNVHRRMMKLKISEIIIMSQIKQMKSL